MGDEKHRLNQPDPFTLHLGSNTSIRIHRLNQPDPHLGIARIRRGTPEQLSQMEAAIREQELEMYQL